jgi:hypothetical protein
MDEEEAWMRWHRHDDAGYHVTSFAPAPPGAEYDPGLPGIDRTGLLTPAHLAAFEQGAGRLLVPRSPDAAAGEGAVPPFAVGLKDKYFPLVIVFASGHLRAPADVDRFAAVLDRVEALARERGGGGRLDLVLDLKKLRGADHDPLLDAFYRLVAFPPRGAMPRVEGLFRRVCVLCEPSLRPALRRVVPARWRGYHPDGFRFGVVGRNKDVDAFMRRELRPPQPYLPPSERPESTENTDYVTRMDARTADALRGLVARAEANKGKSEND